MAKPASARWHRWINPASPVFPSLRGRPVCRRPPPAVACVSSCDWCASTRSSRAANGPGAGRDSTGRHGVPRPSRRERQNSETGACAPASQETKSASCCATSGKRSASAAATYPQRKIRLFRRVLATFKPHTHFPQPGQTYPAHVEAPSMRRCDT